MGKASNVSLDEHVASIIAEKGPEGAIVGQYDYNHLDLILSEIHRRKNLMRLKAYHFRNTRNMWNLVEGFKNYELAREATGELITKMKKMCGWKDKAIIKYINFREFQTQPLSHGVKLSGMLTYVYDDSPSAAVIDYYKHHSNREVREEFKDLRPYHFSRCPLNIWRRKGKKKYKLAREAMGEFYAVVHKKYGWTYSDLMTKLTKDDFMFEKIKYGATLGGMFERVYDSSPSKAIMDFLQNHPCKRVRERFKNLKPYHFSDTPKRTWVKNKRKNYVLARESITELIGVLMKKYKWTKKQTFENLQGRHFKRETLEYGAKLQGMFKTIYNGSIKKLKRDYQKHA